MKLKWYLWFKDVRKTQLIAMVAVHTKRGLTEYPSVYVPILGISYDTKSGDVTHLVLADEELRHISMSPKELHRRAKPVNVLQEDVIRTHWGMAKWAWPELDNPLRLQWNTYNPDAS